MRASTAIFLILMFAGVIFTGAWALVTYGPAGAVGRDPCHTFWHNYTGYRNSGKYIYRCYHGEVIGIK